MSFTFQEERVIDCWDEVYALAKQHHAMTKSYRRHEPFNPDRDRFIAYNEANVFHCLTCRFNGELVGYFGVYVMPSMHSRLPIATEDTFYLSPDYRKGRIAWRFLRFVEEFFQQFAPIEVLFSCEIDNKTGIHGLLGLLAYQPVITVYRKQILPGADSAVPTEETAHASV